MSNMSLGPFDNLWCGWVKQTTDELLRQTAAALKAAKIPWMLAYGSLLGYVRHKGPIPWDDDVDLLIDGPMFQKNKTKLIREMRKRKLVPTEGHGRGGSWGIDGRVLELLKVHLKNASSELPGFRHRYPFIDFYLYETTPDKKSIWVDNVHAKVEDCPWIVLPRSLKLINGDFDGVQVSVPEDPLPFLNDWYGSDWFETCKASSWSHAREELTPWASERLSRPCASLPSPFCQQGPA